MPSRHARRTGPPVATAPRSDGVRPALAGAHPDDRLDLNGPDLPVADPPGLRGLGDDADQVLGVIIITEQLNADLGDHVHLVLSTAVDLCVPTLPTVTTCFTHCHAMHPESLQGGLDIIEFEWLDDSRNEPHVTTLSYTCSDNALPAFHSSSQSVSGM